MAPFFFFFFSFLHPLLARLGDSSWHDADWRGGPTRGGFGASCQEERPRVMLAASSASCLEGLRLNEHTLWRCLLLGVTP